MSREQHEKHAKVSSMSVANVSADEAKGWALVLLNPHNWLLCLWIFKVFPHAFG